MSETCRRPAAVWCDCPFLLTSATCFARNVEPIAAACGSSAATDRRAVCQRYGRNCEPLGSGKCSAANECVNGSQRRYPFAARKRRGLAYDVELGLERSAYPNVLEHQERAEAVGCRREQTAMSGTFSSATECRTVQLAATIDER